MSVSVSTSAIVSGSVADNKDCCDGEKDEDEEEDEEEEEEEDNNEDGEGSVKVEGLETGLRIQAKGEY